jgi:ADP-heptose:LPS heptosyltransferase/GR25 family glycosyltransferase involved in LPS biosynthesis
LKPIIYDIRNSRGLGDTISSSPTLRKIHNSYNQKVIVITEHPEVFLGNPYVSKVLKPTEADNTLNYTDYIHHKSFDNIGHPDHRGVEMKHNTMDIRQIHSVGLGFMLTDDELQTEYYRTTEVIIENLPKNYVLIHPVQSWPNRTWSAENLQILVKKLNERGIPVVSIGKDSSEVGFHNVEKPVFNFEIELGLNLMNTTTLDEAHYLIENAMCLITMDSGMLHLAGTTDTEIILLGSAINPKLRIPYRNGSQNYKIDYVKGSCDLMCASDMKYGVKEWKTIQGVPPLVNCLENKSTFECHPSVNKVLQRVIGLVEPFYRKNDLHKTPNIKLVHLLLDLEKNFDIPHDKWESNIERQTQSVNCFKDLSNKLTTYTQINSFVNRTELPRQSVDIDLPHRVFESIEDTTPPHLSYGHFGAFNAHRRALTTEFTDDVDALIVVESDVVFDITTEQMYEEIQKAYKFGIEHNAAMITFAGCLFDSKFPNSYQYVEDFNHYFKIPHFILGSMYMVFKPQKPILIEKFKNSGWHSPDLWLAENYHLQYPIFGTKNSLVHQATGFSLIDYKVKDTHGNYFEDTKPKTNEKKMNTIKLDKNRVDLFQEFSIRFPKGKGAEVGTFKGQFSKLMIEKWSGTLYMVDVWRGLGDEYIDSSNHHNYDGGVYSEAMKNIEGFEDRAIMVRASSEVASSMFEDESLDFVYIDANHAYDWVVQDIKLWYPKVKKGGVLWGHDYLGLDWTNPPSLENGKDKHIWMKNQDDPNAEYNYAGIFGVNPAVDEFCFENNYDLYLSNEWIGSWLIYKR